MLTIAIGQAKSRPGQLQANLDLGRRWAMQAAAAGAELLVLPELFDWGYDLGALAAAGPQEQSLGFSSIAREAGLTIVAGVAVENAGVRNAAIAFEPGGRRQEYHKIHLFESGSNPESRVFRSGESRGRWEIAGIPAAPIICYDLRFPELARAASLDGAQMLLVSSAWPESRREVFRVLNQARAIENQVFVISANLCGSSAAGSFAGHSMVVSPDGSILAEAGAEEELLVAGVDLALVEKARGFMPCFSQRRPDAYR
jgi:omega-amidase